MKILFSIKKRPLNLVLLVGAAGLYLLNNLYLKHVTGGLLYEFMNGYFNDLICPLFFLSYSNILLISVSREMSKLWQLALFSLAAGLVWEFFAPVIKKGSITDLKDLVCYQLGTIVYWILQKRLK